MADIFAIVSLNFERLGAVPVENFLAFAKYDSQEIDYSLDQFDLNPKGPQPQDVLPVEAPPSEAQKSSKAQDRNTARDSASTDALERLQSHYKPSALQWKFEQDSILLPTGKHTTWKARLSIIKPSRQTITFNSGQCISSVLAQSDAARKAIDDGALNTETTEDDAEEGQILELSKSQRKRERRRLKREEAAQKATEESASGSAPAVSVSAPLEAPNPNAAVSILEEYFMRHKHPNSILTWYPYTVTMNGHGYALLVKASDTLRQVYSTPATFTSDAEAKEACAQAALKEGFRAFVKTFQILPPDTQISAVQRNMDVQTFYDTMDQSFRNSLGWDVDQIQPIQRMAHLFRKAANKGLSHSYHKIRQAEPLGVGRPKSSGRSGHVLRFELHGETRSYIVEPCFTDSKQAKVAVCLQAMSQGAADYLESLETKQVKESKQVKRKMTDLAKHIERALEPLSDLHFLRNDDLHGATLTLKPSPKVQRIYSVPCEYSTQAHAKVALLCIAARDGAIEFARFNGKQPHRDYIPYLANDAARALEDCSGTREIDDIISESTTKKKNAMNSTPPLNLPQFTPPVSLSSYPGSVLSAGSSSTGTGQSAPSLANTPDLARLRASVQMSRKRPADDGVISDRAQKTSRTQ